MVTRFRIVSGGQTGVDRAALDAAIEAGIACGGWCPRGRRAEDGPIPEHYPLRERASARYTSRTLANVRDSDGTLVIVRHADELAEGTRLTVARAERLGRPLRVIDLSQAAAPDLVAAEVADWIAREGIAVLNVAGPRESKSPGIYAAARALVAAVLKRLIRSRS